MLKFMSLCANYMKASSSTLLSNTADLVSQQTRNTFILKRKYPPRLHKKNRRPRTLRSRNYVYELVEDTNIKKQKDINVILMKTVEKYGPAGAMISVPTFKAYDQLLLPKFAVYATPENIEKYAVQDLTGVERKGMSIETQTEQALSTLDLSVVMSMENEWTLEKKHIRISFRKAGFIVAEDAFTMPTKPIKGPNLDLDQKQFYVTVTLKDSKTINVRCRIFHWTADPKKKILYEEPYWKLPCKAIFPEDQEILDNMPKHVLLQKEEKSKQGVTHLNTK